MRKKKSEITTLNSKSYREFLPTLILVALGLENSSCKLDRGLYARLRREQDRGVRRIDARYEISKFHPDFFDATAHFTVTIEDRKTKQRALAVECSFGSHFHGKKPFAEDFARRFASSEFRFIVWPFFREYIFDLTARMAIPPVTIPIQLQAD
jgi:preprotein translocase subunit SecB